MPFPTSSTFDVLDWRDEVKISDPVQGLLINPDVSILNAGLITDCFDLYITEGFEEGDGLTAAGGAWVGMVLRVFSDRVRVSASATPEVGQVVSNGAILRTVQCVEGLLQIAASSGAVRIRVGTPLHAGGTLEVWLRAESLPREVDAVNRVELGLANDEGSLFLQVALDGLGYTRQLAGPVDPMSGTQSLTGTSATWVYRITSEPEDRTIYIYATQLSQLDRTGHILRRTVPYGKGKGTDEVVLTFSDARVDLIGFGVSSEALVSNERPVADPGADRTVSLGEQILLDGSNSYDPDGQVLTYLWDVLEVPDGATFKLDRPQYASGLLEWPSGAKLTLTASTVGAAANRYSMTLVEDESLHPPHPVSVDTSDELEVAVTFLPGVATADDLLAALAAASVPFSAEATDGGELLFAGAVDLVGGADGSGRVCVLKVDQVGLYRVGLTVHDGQLYSDQVWQSFLVAESEVALGQVPDGNLLWMALHDVWELFTGREPYATIMSAMMQLAGSLQTELWQYRDGRSVETAGRTFLRTWVRFPIAQEAESFTAKTTPLRVTKTTAYPHLETPTTAQTSVLRWSEGASLRGVAAGDLLALWPNWSSPYLAVVRSIQPLTSTGTATFSSADRTITRANVLFSGLGLVPGDYVQIDNAGEWVLARIQDVRSHQLVLRAGPALSSLAEGTYEVSYAVGGVVTLEGSVTAFQVVDEGPLDALADDLTCMRIGGKQFSADIRSGDFLRLYPRGGGEPSWYEVDSLGAGLTEIITLSTMGVQTAVRWDVARPVHEGGVGLWNVPVYEQVAGGLPDVDDLVEFSGGTLGTVMGTLQDDVLGNFVGVIPAYSYEEDLTSLELQYVRRLSRLIGGEYLTGVPRLQESPGDASDSLIRGRDFYVAAQEDGDRSVVWVDVVSGATLDYDGEVYTTSEDLEDLGVTIGDTLLVPLRLSSGRPAVYGPARVTFIEGSEVELEWLHQEDEPLGAFSGQSFVIPIFGAFNPPADHLWAEEAYYDDSAAIEESFGVLVGLPIEALDTVANLDYLGAVRAVWFAFQNGPTVENLRIASQAFLGLPVASKRGTVVELDEDYSATKSRIVIRDEDEGYQTYYFPSGLTLETNPSTGVPYVVGDTVQRHAPLCDGVEVLDYIKDPQWAARYYRGVNELRKFHTFAVRVNLEELTQVKPEALSALRAYLSMAKPEHTDFTLLGLFQLPDNIDIEDALSVGAQLRLRDALYSTTDLSERLPTSSVTGRTMQSGFTHQWDGWDGAGKVPLGEFCDYAPAARTIYWLECAERSGGRFQQGEVIYPSGAMLDKTISYALEVLYDGPSYLLVRQLPWVFDIEVADRSTLVNPIYADLRVEDEMIEGGDGGPFPANLGNRWNGWIIGTGNEVPVVTTARIVLTDQSALMPTAGGAAGDPDEINGVETLLSVVQAPVVEVQEGDELAGTQTAPGLFTVGAIHRYPDTVSALDRELRVGPSTRLRAILRFLCTEAPQQQKLSVTGTADVDDVIVDSATDPTFFSRVLYSEA